MTDEKVNMGPEENKVQKTLSPPGQGELPPLEENNAPAISGEYKGVFHQKSAGQKTFSECRSRITFLTAPQCGSPCGSGLQRTLFNQWKPDQKADAVLPVLHGTVPAVSQHCRSNDGKAQPRSTAIAVVGLVPTVERFKKMRQVLRWDSGSVIIYAEVGL